MQYESTQQVGVPRVIFGVLLRKKSDGFWAIYEFLQDARSRYASRHECEGTYHCDLFWKNSFVRKEAFKSNLVVKLSH